MPEDSNFRIWSSVFYKLGKKCKMIILDKYKRIFLVLDLFHYCICIQLIYFLVVVPIFFSKNRAGMSDMTKGPQAFIRKTIVIMIFLLLGQPNTSKCIF